MTPEDTANAASALTLGSSQHIRVTVPWRPRLDCERCGAPMSLRIDLEPFLLSVSWSCPGRPDNPYPGYFVVETPEGPMECQGFVCLSVSDHGEQRWDIELSTSNAPAQ